MGISTSDAQLLEQVWRLATKRLGVPRPVGPAVHDSDLLWFMLDKGSQGRLTQSMSSVGMRYQAGLSFHQRARWAQYGFPVFRLTHGLAASLILTDCRGVSSEDVRLPFDAFMVDLPYPNSPISFASIHTGEQVPGRFLTVHSYLAAPTGADAKLAARLAFLSKQTAREQIEYAAAPAGLEPRLGVSIVADDMSEARFDWNLPGAGERFEVMLARIGSVGGGDSDRPLVSTDAHALSAAARLVVNLALYLSSTREREREWARHGGAQTRYERDGSARPTTWVIGQGIRVSPQLQEAARAFSQNGDSRAAWRVRSRFVVRGHWRNQACGKGRQDRKHIWILPHWKGPEDGIGLTRLYQTTEAVL